jgi:hypothetical protein
MLGHVAGKGEQLIGSLPHGAHNRNDAAAVLVRADDSPSNISDPARIGDRRTAVFLNYKCHGVKV